MNLTITRMLTVVAAPKDDGQISEVTSISLGFTQDVMGGSASAGLGSRMARTKTVP